MKREVERLDNDDEAFLAKLREPLFLDKNHSEFFTYKMEEFLLHIFTQDFTKAFRRGKGLRLKKEAEYQVYVRIRNFIKSVCSVRHWELFKALRARKSTIRKKQ
ncbi:hypothetical protein ACRE1S_01590 [Helicobacter himalayensis]|uniref:hypothetical protein n=1 Tax=Helicobacter himalayensis TaxID=1591088 RepID=UPI003D6DF94E